MTARILFYQPADPSETKTQAYGHVFTAGVAHDLGEDEAAFARLKANPEFSTEGKKRSFTFLPDEPVPAADPSGDESNDGKDAKTRAAVQARALKAARAEAGKASA